MVNIYQRKSDKTDRQISFCWIVNIIKSIDFFFFFLLWRTNTTLMNPGINKIIRENVWTGKNETRRLYVPVGSIRNITSAMNSYHLHCLHSSEFRNSQRKKKKSRSKHLNSLPRQQCCAAVGGCTNFLVYSERTKSYL